MKKKALIFYLRHDIISKKSHGAQYIMINWLLNLDGNILLFIQNNIRNPIFTPIFQLITTLADGGMIWILLTLLMLCIPKTRKVGYMATVALIGSLLINNIFLKNVVARTRPYEMIEELICLVRKPRDYSFPSGHTTTSFAAAWVMFRQLPKRFGVPTLVLAILIALSRLYVGVHYPSDVLFGALDGIAIGYGAEMFVDWLGKRKSKNKST